MPCVTTCGEISFTLTNRSEFNWLLYNFNSNFNFGVDLDSSYCTDGGVADRVIFVYNMRNEQIRAAFVLPDSVHGVQMSMEEVLRRHERGKTDMRKYMQVVNIGSSSEFKRVIDFREFDLMPGVYFARILFFQHDLSKYLTEQQLRSDRIENDARVFKGCLWSNTVRLIVD